MKTHLTQHQLAAFSSTQGKTCLFDTELPDFVCGISAASQKSFRNRFQDEYDGQRHEEGVDFMQASIKEAWERAGAALQAVSAENSFVLSIDHNRRVRPTLAEFVRKHDCQHSSLYEALLWLLKKEPQPTDVPWVFANLKTDQRQNKKQVCKGDKASQSQHSNSA